jgi:hypothetical protein
MDKEIERKSWQSKRRASGLNLCLFIRKGIGSE